MHAGHDCQQCLLNVVSSLTSVGRRSSLLQVHFLFCKWNSYRMHLLGVLLNRRMRLRLRLLLFLSLTLDEIEIPQN